MSERESFLSRWSRLKRESDTAGIGGEKPVEIVASTDAAVLPTFDPASLPSIESIVAESDVRPFLAAGVPPELTRAALRSAWAADPSIRDFIGIAESQWDFNQADAIPGFGPLSIAEYRRALEAQAHAGSSVAEVPPESLNPLEPPAAADTDAQAAPAAEVRHVAAVLPESPPDGDSGARVAGAMTVQPGTASRESEVDASPPPPSARRLHGGALPK
jgi:hypothetical protein